MSYRPMLIGRAQHQFADLIDNRIAYDALGAATRVAICAPVRTRDAARAPSPGLPAAFEMVVCRAGDDQRVRAAMAGGDALLRNGVRDECADAVPQQHVRLLELFAQLVGEACRARPDVAVARFAGT